MPSDYSQRSAIAEAQLAARLRDAEIPFIQNFAVAGVEVDFAFTFGDKRLILAELKAWDPTPENIDRAAMQAQLYTERTKASAVYVVIPQLPESELERRVVNVGTLVSILLNELGALKTVARRVVHVKPSSGRWSVVVAGTRLPHTFASQAAAADAGRAMAKGQRSQVVIHGRSGRIVSKDSFGADPVPPRDHFVIDRSHKGRASQARKRAKTPAPKRTLGPPTQPKAEITLFAAMPFAPEYDDVFMVAMAGAASELSGVCRRVDHEAYSGDVVDRIKAMIRACDAVIVDLSDSRPNVLYEAGYAEALGKPTVQICSTPLDALPFDVRNRPTLGYKKGQTLKLLRPLVNQLRGVLGSRSKIRHK